MFNSLGFRARGEAAITAGMNGLPGAVDRSPVAPTITQAPVWVIHASETGVAEHLARDASRALHDAGVASRRVGFDDLDLQTLQTVEQALFVVSTCYDGDPPNMAEPFFRQHMQRPVALGRLRYGLLALGDSYYDEFCGFGRTLHRWLCSGGAQAWFEPIEMDNEDEAAARSWSERVDTLIRLHHAAGSPAA